MSDHDMTASGVTLEDIIEVIYTYRAYPGETEQVNARLLMEVIELKKELSKLEDRVMDLERAE